MFILVTLAHNEIEQVDELVNCIRNSTLQPDCWIVMDDCSSDGTGNRFMEVGGDLPFLEVHRIKTKDNYMGFHYSEVLQFGLDLKSKLVEKAHFIGILDVDIRFGMSYWKKLANSLEKDPSLGIVSGALCYRENSQLFPEPYQRIDLPRGGLRLIKGRCFNDVGGITRSRAPDTIMTILAKSKGWKTMLLPDVFAESIRKTDMKDNNLSGMESRGQRAWNLYHPFWQVVVRAIALGSTGKLQEANAYLQGYLKEWKAGGERFPDKIIQKYYRFSRTREWVESIWYNLSGKYNPHQMLPVKLVSVDKIYC